VRIPSRMSAEAVVQDHGAVRTIGLATSEAVTGDREDACSISAGSALSETVNGVSSGGCRDDVSGAVREEARVCLSMLRSHPLRTQPVGPSPAQNSTVERHRVYPTIPHDILRLVAEFYLNRQQVPESPIMEGDFRTRPIPSPNG
jgi:hypothetical protein